MGKVTVLALKSMNYKLSESVGGRGDGALLFEKRKSGTIEVYYRYKHQGKDSKVKIGQYKATRDGHGYTLAECRDKAQDIAIMRREAGGDLKAFLDEKELKQKQLETERKQKEQIEAAKGTLSDLLNSYVASLERQGKPTAKDARYMFDKHVVGPFPKLAEKKAHKVSIEDISDVLRLMITKGVTTSCNRTRSFLHAAFGFGLKADHDPRHQLEHGSRFYLQHNPVSAIPRQADFEKARDRSLNHDEVQKLWGGVMDVKKLGKVMGLFIRFMLATGGQRPKQILACSWDRYDTFRRTLLIDDTKGRGGNREHLIPLTDRALAILEEVREITADYPWPFATNHNAPIRLDSLSTAFTRYCVSLEEEAKQKGRPLPERFTAKDIRRTAHYLMVDAGLTREERNLLQNHAQAGIDTKHYNRHDQLPEKREAIRKYDAWLTKVIEGKVSKLVDLEVYRQQAASEQQ